MQKFLVLYLAPVAVLEEWMKTDPETRNASEVELRDKWNAWMKEHENQLQETAGAGKTKQITAEGIKDTKNDVMLYSIVEADSSEAAAELFKGHPHLEIPEASIEVMAINPLTGM